MNRPVRDIHRRMLSALLLGILLSGLLFAMSHGRVVSWRYSPAIKFESSESAATQLAQPKAARPAAPQRVNSGNLAPTTTAQSEGSYNLSQSVISGGGGTSAGGSNAVLGSVGQSVLGTASGGSFALVGGF